MGTTSRDSIRRNLFVYASRESHRTGESSSCSSTSLCDQSCRACDSMSPGDSGGQQPRRLSLGSGSQETVAKRREKTRQLTFARNKAIHEVHEIRVISWVVLFLTASGTEIPCSYAR